MDIVDRGNLEEMSKVEEVGIDGEIQMVDVRNPKKAKRQMEAREGSTPQNNQGEQTNSTPPSIVKLQRDMGMAWLDKIGPWAISFLRFVHFSRLHLPPSSSLCLLRAASLLTGC